MGYAHYKIRRNGEQIDAGYGVEAVCEKTDCATTIDRGLAYLCGQTPGGDEQGCGGYFCAEHLTGNQQCEPCAKAADEANTWTNPETGEEFDLRDEYLPEGEEYKPDGWVWKHLGGFQNDVPVLVPVKLQGRKPGGHLGCAITEYDFRVAGGVAWRQELAAKTAKSEDPS
jgi:hypothetical protein